MPRHPSQDRVLARQSLLQVHQKLTAQYQLKPPITLSRLVSFALDLVYDNEYIRADEDLANCFVPAFYLSGFLEGEPMFDPTIPCEFFAFASPRVDGIDYGFVVHTPELALEDFLVCELDPKDDLRGLRLLGSTFAGGLETLLSRALASAKEQPEVWSQSTSCYGLTPTIVLHRIRALSVHLGVYPEQQKARPVIFDSNGPAPKPSVPKGWRFVPSVDGVGVLAPSLFFGEYQAETEALDTEYDCDPEPVLDFATQAMAQGSPASALWVLREAIFYNMYLDEQIERFAPLLEQAYLALNRPLFASMIARWRARLL